MKKSEAVTKLQKFCKDWENCDLNEKFAKKLLFFIENGLEMSPPLIPTGASGWEIGKGVSAFINEWEKE